VEICPPDADEIPQLRVLLDGLHDLVVGDRGTHLPLCVRWKRIVRPRTGRNASTPAQRFATGRDRTKGTVVCAGNCHTVGVSHTQTSCGATLTTGRSDNVVDRQIDLVGRYSTSSLSDSRTLGSLRMSRTRV
jgi:hypothetical protein